MENEKLNQILDVVLEIKEDVKDLRNIVINFERQANIKQGLIKLEKEGKIDSDFKEEIENMLKFMMDELSSAVV